ncbi:DUF3526 domain-containing protein [Pseudemcibacter aquimaris]|uniref:DUF3526 domain-containing protein n=1 Tax=Pseudemcibacter aquimaris TaxID=2857064 RepID=UPI002012149E|nr:DUF3526 domain-containing protein [Pseudemcibacter aquimaris]MCC3861407.1 DUF3526 domain-containing protein [Pseudemcibacter aquimaris]WDU58177.1 DUF3526 domain-containing protein [Pseudemcibacter aquimaris]
MTLSDIISHEWKSKLSHPVTLINILLFAAILIFGSFSGALDRDSRISKIEAHHQGVSAKTENWLKNAKAWEEKGKESGVSSWSGSAAMLTLPTSLTPGVLGDFAIGQSDFLPFTGEVALRQANIKLFSKYEFDDPVSLALGAFDLSKAVIFILPLLLIVLCFDVLSSERDSNRLGLTMAQGINLRSFFWRRVFVRGSIVLGLTIVVSTLMFIIQTNEFTSGRLSMFFIWLTGVILYAFFWMGIISFIASKNKNGETNVISLLILWAGFTLIIPAAATSVTETIYPTPSRLAYMAEAREMENEAGQEIADIANKYLLDHPELSISDESEMPAFLRTGFIVTKTTDEAISPILEEFETTALERENTLGLLRYLSPAITTHILFNDAAGTSSKRHNDYQKAVRDFKNQYAERVGPLIMSNQRLSMDEFNNIAEFHFDDQKAGQVFSNNLVALLFLALLSGILLIMADKRVRGIKGPKG